MAVRSPTAFHAYWGIFATYGDLPNVAGSGTQNSNLQVGDQAYVTADSMLYFCIDATLGAAIWSVMGLGPANFDAFGRLRISAPQTVFDSKLVYDTQPLYWSEAQTGGAAAGVWSQPDARVRLTVAAGQTSVRQSRRYFTYQPGKSQLIFCTFNLNSGVAGTVKRAGYFDSADGFFLELDGAATVNFVRRSSSSVPTTTVAQGAWNLDPMNGTGPSGITLNFAETQILVIDFEWLGVGSARMGFVVNGTIYYAHRFDNANINPAVYMSTPNLPIRYEIDATGGGAGSIDCICSSVASEGGLQGTGTKFGFALPTRVTGLGNGVSATLFSIRHNGTYPRVTIIPTSVGPLADSNGTSKWELIYNPSFAINPAWVGATRGYCDIDTPASTAAGSAGQVTAGTGTVIAAGVFSNSTPASNLDLVNTTLTLGNPVTVNNAGTASVDYDVISLVVTNTSGGNANYQAAIDWLALT
jgi:hypothetical protein